MRLSSVSIPGQRQGKSWSDTWNVERTSTTAGCDWVIHGRVFSIFEGLKRGLLRLLHCRGGWWVGVEGALPQVRVQSCEIK